MSNRWMTFMFRNELDMLECQLYQNYESVHRFVLVEASVNHQGKPKPLVYQENRERFATYADKIIHLDATEAMPTVAQNPDPWSRERAQRDYAIRELWDIPPDDIVHINDVDEIPNPNGIRVEPAAGSPMALRSRYCFAAVDWEGDGGWNGAVIRASDLHFLPSLTEFRARSGQFTMVDGSWHISWLGGQSAIYEKLEAFCHLEHKQQALEANADDSMYRKAWANGHGGAAGRPVDVDESWPRWIYERKCPPIWFRPRS